MALGGGGWKFQLNMYNLPSISMFPSHDRNPFNPINALSLSLSLSLSKPNLLQMPSNLIKLGFKNINWCHFEKKYCVREAGQELDLASHNGGFVGLVWIDYGWIDWLLNKVFVVELIKIKIKWKMKNKKSIIIFLKQNFISFYFLIF